jgi:hypothetical protein
MTGRMEHRADLAHPVGGLARLEGLVLAGLRG